MEPIHLHGVCGGLFLFIYFLMALPPERTTQAADADDKRRDLVDTLCFILIVSLDSISRAILLNHNLGFPTQSFVLDLSRRANQLYFHISSSSKAAALCSPSPRFVDQIVPSVHPTQQRKQVGLFLGSGSARG